MNHIAANLLYNLAIAALRKSSEENEDIPIGAASLLSSSDVERVRFGVTSNIEARAGAHRRAGYPYTVPLAVGDSATMRHLESVVNAIAARHPRGGNVAPDARGGRSKRHGLEALYAAINPR